MFTSPEVRKAFRLKTRVTRLLFGFIAWLVLAAAQSPERPPLSVKPVNTLTSEWLVFDAAANKLVAYLPEGNTGPGTYYQWVTIRRDYPFEISFPATRNLSLFLNNQLIFKADSSANHTLDLTSIILLPKPSGKYLLAVWSPEGEPRLDQFVNASKTDLVSLPDEEAVSLQNKPRSLPNQNAFILCLILIGLIYGSLRWSFAADFNSVFRIGNLFRKQSLEEGFLAKPISSWSSILFIIAFSLSFSLLIAAIHTNIQNSFIFNRLFWVSESDIISRIVTYAITIFGFILLKYVFLQILAYIFDLSELVVIQYREFLRSVLFTGVILPFIMLLYLAFNNKNPSAVLLVSTIAVSALLVITTLRVVLTLNKKVPLRNLHLFSYICATEIIPLTVMLKLIMYNY